MRAPLVLGGVMETAARAGVHDAFTSAVEIQREARPEDAVRWALEHPRRQEV
jgi:hypothetical protein